MKHKILVVDDQKDERDAMADLLRHHHYVVDSAANGQEALERMCDGAPLPALVLLDLNMPVMDGWEFLYHVAHDSSLRRIAVVVISGCSVVEDAIVVPASTTFVAKPVSPHALMRVITEILRRAGRPAAATTVAEGDQVDTEAHAASRRGHTGVTPRDRGDQGTVWSPSMLP